MEDPLLDEALLASRLGDRDRNEGLIEFEHSELGCVEDLVAELAVTLNTQNLQVDVTA